MYFNCDNNETKTNYMQCDSFFYKNLLTWNAGTELACRMRELSGSNDIELFAFRSTVGEPGLKRLIK